MLCAQGSSDASRTTFTGYVSDVPLEMQASRKRSVSTSMVQIEEASNTSRVVEEDYDFHRAVKIGRGGFGDVFAVPRRDSDVRYAIKTVNVSATTSSTLRESNSHSSDPSRPAHRPSRIGRFTVRLSLAVAGLHEEIKLQRELDHPHIVKVFGAYENPARSKLYVM